MKSQSDLILQVLQRRKGAWVGLSTLAKASGSLSPATRISNLRAAGYRIENKQERVRRKCGLVVLSSYRLNPPLEECH
jgi:hypothetical protein